MAYYIATDRFGNYDLEHGTKWRQHKYIRKEGNRYIYPEDLRKSGDKKSKETSTSGSNSSSKRYIDDEYQRALGSNSRPNIYPNSDVARARDLAQQRGYSRTQYYKKDGFDSKSLTSYPNGEKKWNTEYTKPRLEREFEQNAPERRAQQEAKKKRIAAEEAARQAQERGERRTHLEDNRAASVKRKAAVNRAMNSVKKWGSNTLNSAKGAAAKGAAWVSNLLKRKK